MNRQHLWNIAKIAISIVLLIYIFSTLDVPAFLETIRTAHFAWLMAALITMLTGIVLRAWRWQILLHAIGVYVSLLELTAIYFIGFLFNNLLPSGLGGDAIRMLELHRHTLRGSDAFTSVIVDRFLGLAGLQLLAIIALLVDWGAVPVAVAYATVGLFVVSVSVGYLLINRPLYQWLQAHLGLFRRLTEIRVVHNVFNSFQSYPLPALGRSFLVSIGFNITLVAMNIFIGAALGAEASWIQYAIFVPITSIVLLIPISFAGLGVREETYRQLFGRIGVPPEIAVGISLLVYIIGNICTGLIGGVIYLLRSTRDVVKES